MCLTKTNLKLGAALFAAALLTLNDGCRKEAETLKNDLTPEVETVIASVNEYKDELTGFGTINYKNKNDITAIVEGSAEFFYAKENEYVKKGQKIALLKNVKLELQKEEALNTLEQGKSQLKVLETKLWENKLSVRSRLIGLKKTELAIEQKTLDIKKKKIDLDNNKELLDIGGISRDAYDTLDLSYKSALYDLDIMKNEQQSALLGLDGAALVSNGITPSPDEEVFHEQIINLNLRGIMSEIESTKSAIGNAESDLAIVNKMLDELNLYSPIDGVIGARYYEEGEFIKEGERVFTIMNIEDVYAVFSIQEQDIVNFDRGSLIELDIQSVNMRVTGKIDEISASADAQSGNFQVKSLVKNDGLTLKPGMFVKCNIPRRSGASYISIPEPALAAQLQNKGTVFCVVNNIAVQKEIKIMARGKGMVWVESGLEEGDAVVNRPSPFLKEGMNVKIKI